MTLDPQQGGPAAGYGQMRSSTVDKERAVDVLKAGFAEGRLTKDEYEQRVERVLSSRTYAELATITSDLPSGPLGAMLPQPRSYPVAPVRQRTNGLAIASLICALIPGIPSVAAIALGITARGQIKERGDGGVGLANTGIAIGSFFLLVLVIYGLTRI